MKSSSSISGSQIHHLAGEAFASKQGDLHDWGRSRKPASLEIVSKTQASWFTKKTALAYSSFTLLHGSQRVPSSAEQEGRGRRRRGRGWHCQPAAERHAVHSANRQPGLEPRQAGPVRVLGLRSVRPRAHRHQTQHGVKMQTWGGGECAICSDGGLWLRSPPVVRESRCTF